MTFLAKVLIGRSVVSLDRPFTYLTEDDSIKAGMRVLVSFGSSQSTIGFVLEDPLPLTQSVEDYEKANGIHLSRIHTKLDQDPLLTPALLTLAKEVGQYYKADQIQVLSAFLPPSLKPKNSSLKKSQGKTATFALAKDISGLLLSKNEKALYAKIAKEPNGIRTVHISAKASLAKLVSKQAVELKEVPVYRIPEFEAQAPRTIELTQDQQAVHDAVLNGTKSVYLLQGVTGSGKTEVYLKLAESYLKMGKGVLVLVPEIALTDHMADLFASTFKDSVSILNSSLSDARKYDEYRRISLGETTIVLGTRSAIFAPVRNLGLIIIDEEHSDSYKQDNAPFYDAIKVAEMRSQIESVKVLLGSATPRIIDKARAEKGIYEPLFLKQRFAANQEHDLTIINMADSANFDPHLSGFYSKPLIEELTQNLKAHEQSMILINRRGYSPIYLCRNCHQVAKCPNCHVPLNYHKRDGMLRCHHCGYQIAATSYQCPCGSHDFLELGFGTERAYEDLAFLFPNAKILRLDSDVSSNDVRHEILADFSQGEADILVGTQIIAKGHDFPEVTLAAVLDSDSSLRLPTYMANEETFDLLCQFVGRAGRAKKKGRILLQTYFPDSRVIQLAAKQDYETFYQEEMEERRKYQYPPYTYLCAITLKGVDNKLTEAVSEKVRLYLDQACVNKRVNIYGPTSPYIPYANGRYYRSILLKYKSIEEMSPILDGIKTIRLANKDVDILINVDPGRENL
jgi:primosomal protein N' (replication factor Y)